MKKRMITAIVALILFIPVLIFSDTWALPIAASAAAVIACFEMFSCIGQKKNLVFTIPTYILAAAFPILARVAKTQEFMSQADFIKLALAMAIIAPLYMFAVSVFQTKTMCVTDAGLAAFSCFYIIAAFTCLIYIRDFAYLGQHVYLLCFICAWITDTFAYFTGMLLGKHKLIPEVSPKKTIEGAIGGVVFCSVAMVVFGLIIETFFNPENSFHANYLVLALSGIAISAISQTGDLIMSLIKRKYQIKDYGKIFPGHGGVLDRCDSVIAVSLAIAFITSYFNMFTV